MQLLIRQFGRVPLPERLVNIIYQLPERDWVHVLTQFVDQEPLSVHGVGENVLAAFLVTPLPQLLVRDPNPEREMKGQEPVQEAEDGGDEHQ